VEQTSSTKERHTIMMGRSHFVSGIVAFEVTAEQMHYTPTQAVIGAIVVSSAALLPDIDHPQATVSRAVGPISRVVSLGIAKLAGGHRRGTHCLIGIGLLAAIAQGCVVHRHSLLGMIVLSVILILTLAAGVRILRIPGLVDDLAPIPVVLVGVCMTNIDLTTVPVALMIGCLAHSIGDSLTNSGWMPFWPLSEVRIKFGLFKTGGKFEKLVVFPVLVVAAIGMAWWKVWATITG
jgi:membrane-bound metal-dependent hydrolase YbcI (DUF457 family)